MLKFVFAAGLLLSLSGCSLQERWESGYLYSPYYCTVSGMFCGVPR